MKNFLTYMICPAPLFGSSSIFLLIFIFFFTAGCSSGIPKHNPVELDHSMNNASAYNMINQYNDSVLQRANLISSITFKFRGRAMSAIGITKLNAENKSFSVAGLNPMAVTLFKLKMKNGRLTSTYVIPQLGGHGNLHKTAGAIGKDIARIYFNRKIDIQGKSLVFDKNRIIIHKKAGGFYYDYIFTGKSLKLIEKIKYENVNKNESGEKIWSVDYYDYKKIKTKRNIKEIPFKIFFKNYKYGYSLDIITRSVKAL